MSRITDALQHQWGAEVFIWLFGDEKFTEEEIAEARAIFAKCEQQIRLLHTLHRNGEDALDAMESADMVVLLESPFLTRDEASLIRNYRATGKHLLPIGTRHLRREPKKKEPNLRGGFLYLARNERNGLTKIGWSANPTLREKTLQSEEPEVSFIFVAFAPFFLEQRLHEQHSHQRIRGEWFDLDASDIAHIQEAFTE